jgi:hypothetical protein
MPMDQRFWHKDNNSTPIIVPIGFALIALLGFLASLGLCASPSRQEEVATKGAKIMPFDLEQTVHHFQPLAWIFHKLALYQFPAWGQLLGGRT